MSDESYTNAVIKEREEFRAHLLDIAEMTNNADTAKPDIKIIPVKKKMLLWNKQRRKYVWTPVTVEFRYFINGIECNMYGVPL